MLRLAFALGTLAPDAGGVKSPVALRCPKGIKPLESSSAMCPLDTNLIGREKFKHQQWSATWRYALP